MRKLLDKVNSKTVKVKFMDTETVEVRKLSVSQVKEFQVELERIKGDEESTESGLSIQRKIIRLGVVGADELTDEELDSFPLADISKLASEILELAGVKAKEGNA